MSKINKARSEKAKFFSFELRIFLCGKKKHSKNSLLHAGSMSYSFSEPIHYHGKGFTLRWNFPAAWLILVYFRNGQKKAWYKRTERPYRFKRWFFLKGEDFFRNIANIEHPKVTLYVFSGIFPLPRKIQISMQVELLQVNEPELISLNLPDYQYPGALPIMAGNGFCFPKFRTSTDTFLLLKKKNITLSVKKQPLPEITGKVLHESYLAFQTQHNLLKTN